VPDDEDHDVLRATTESRIWDFVAATVGSRASIAESTVADGIGLIEVTPYTPGARAIWIVFDYWLTVSVGENGGTWELKYTEEDVNFLISLLAAVFDGRIDEVFAPGRSIVTVTLADGDVVQERGYNGCLPFLVPMPYWPRWGRRVGYLAYSDTAPSEPPRGATQGPPPSQMLAVRGALAETYDVTEITDHQSGEAWFFECRSESGRAVIVSAGDEDDIVVEHAGAFWRDWAVDHADLPDLIGRAAAHVRTILDQQ